MSEAVVTAVPEALKLSGKFCLECGKATHICEVESAVIRNKCLSCGWIDWNPPVFASVAIVPGKRKEKRTILLVQRRDGKWCMPTGYLNSGEHPSAASQRECIEESGITITVGELPVRIVTPPGRNQNLMFYLAETSDGEIKASSDARDAREFALDELPDISFPAHRLVITQYFAGVFDTK